MDNQSFKMKIEDSFKIMGRGVVVTGTIENGVVRKGDFVYVGNKGPYNVKGIEVFRKLLEQACSGMKVGLLISTIEKNDAIKGEYVTSEIK